LAAALLAAAVLAAAPAHGPQFSSSVNVVEVYATVTDKAGEPVTGLAAEAFTVRENGEPQKVTTFAGGEFPLTVAVAVDRSFSMADRLGVAKSAARVFLGELRPGDESAMVAIGSEVEVVTPRSTDRTAQLAAVDRLDAFGTTSLHDAIISSLETLQDAKGRRALVLLSDGGDRFSQASAADVLARARRTDVLVYPVALGRERPPLFAELAALTGGRSQHVRDARRLPDAMRAIARELRHQYLLGYSPSRPLDPAQNEWRSITVTVDKPGVQVRARDGYGLR
jgi:Ca-activated chloride channel homolog